MTANAKVLLPSTRPEAVAQDIIYYADASGCSDGHVPAVRYTTDGSCRLCAKHNNLRQYFCRNQEDTTTP